MKEAADKGIPVRYTAAVDYWGVGVLLEEILMCNWKHGYGWQDDVMVHLYAGRTKDAARLLLVRSKGNQQLVDLCISLLSLDPQMRPGCDEVRGVLEQVLMEAMAAEQAAARKAEEAAAAARRKEEEAAAAARRKAAKRALGRKVSLVG